MTTPDRLDLQIENAIIIHGKPTRQRYEDGSQPKPHVANWLPWLGRQLEELGVSVSIPAIPKPYYPAYDVWKDTVFGSARVDRRTALIGHSAGAELILRWLSENPDIYVDTVALVAPYKDWEGKYGDFSQYELDPRLAERIGRLVIFNSLDDDEPIKRRVRELVSIFPTAQLVEFEDRGHFRIGHNMTGPEFPELLDCIAGSNEPTN